ncbi:MAG: hypothetical protein ACNI3A_18650 [Desulfovibrio sp.]|uniref:hypothetical protein n=1 Tax=Desulfovibrio sp. 7SRBS1 TaxID=3378064 RepID=UPI003B3CC48F
MHLVDETLRLIRAGWLPFSGVVSPAVYKTLNCPQSKKARWFESAAPSGAALYQCLGCSRVCTLRDEPGMQARLPIYTPLPVIPRDDLPGLTAGEMLQRMEVLRWDQAAFVLNIGKSEFYRLVQEGALTRAGPERPVRVTSASVRALLDQRPE